MKVFGHRGVLRWGVAENTIEAIERAVKLGVHGIEFDLHRSRDGVAVVAHDKDLRRIAGDNRRVSNLTWNDLKKIELRHGANIPTLDDVTACVPSSIELDFEVKDRAVLELLIKKLRTSSSLRERAIISSFKRDVLDEARAGLPDVRRAYLINRWMRSQPIMDWVRETDLYGIGVPHQFWTPKRMERVRDAGAKLLAWEHPVVRSSRRRADRLQSIGIDIAIVNQPEMYL